MVFTRWGSYIAGDDVLLCMHPSGRSVGTDSLLLRANHDSNTTSILVKYWLLATVTVI